MKNNFYEQLMVELFSNIDNLYFDNYDPDRFGERPVPKKTWRSVLKKYLKKRLKVNETIYNKARYLGVLRELSPYWDRLEAFYNLLADDESKKLLINILSYRILGEYKYKLPLSTKEYWSGIEEIAKLADENDFVDVKYVENETARLSMFDLNKIQIPIKFYYSAAGIHNHVVVKQYEYKTKEICIKPENGDIVLDCGGCWGDTAIFFSKEVGETGKVFSFEFIPSNIEVFKNNLNLNPNLKDRVTLVPKPLGLTSGNELFYIDNGPGSRLSSDKISDLTVATINIDDFFAEYTPEKIDFIKMDIEGSELSALKGAIDVISKFRPKLAISIYHGMDDFVDIVHYINSLGLGYKFYLKHATIHLEETVLFATTSNE